MPTPTTKRAPKDAAEPTPKPRRTRKPAVDVAAKPSTPEPAKPERGPRGEVLARHGAELEGALAGYVVALAFREFECAKGEAGWMTVCVAHGTHHPAATKAEAERQGARKARAGWCKACTKA
jgi:hypothetical protein